MHMLEETRNMLYGLWPHGCFSHFVELPPPPLVLPILTQVGLQAAPTQVGQSSGSSYSDYHRAPPTQVGVQPAAPAYASVTQAGKVGWTSQVVVAARDDWPPLSAFVVPKRTQHRRPVVVPPVFQSETERAKVQAQARAEVLRTAAPTTNPSHAEAMDVTEEMTPI